MAKHHRNASPDIYKPFTKFGSKFVCKNLKEIENPFLVDVFMSWLISCKTLILKLGVTF